MELVEKIFKPQLNRLREPDRFADEVRIAITLLLLWISFCRTDRKRQRVRYDHDRLHWFQKVGRKLGLAADQNGKRLVRISYRHRFIRRDRDRCRRSALSRERLNVSYESVRTQGHRRKH